MKLRPIEEQDNAAVKQLVQKSLEDADLAVPGTAYFDPHLGDLYHYYQEQEHAQYWVIVENHHVIGGVGIGPLGIPKTCELQKLYISAPFRGRGLSHRLMQQALIFARQSYDRCYLETHSSLTAAVNLYQRWQFEALAQPLVQTPHAAMDMWLIKSLK